MLLSILTLSIPERVGPYLSRLVKQLDEQIGENREVEVLALTDNRRISVGAKWNHLIGIARGQYITCVGEDDVLADDYVSSLLKAIRENPGVDCIVFDTDMYVDGEFYVNCKWGLEHTFDDDEANKQMYRPVGELMCIRSDIRREHPYQNVWRGSDWRLMRSIRSSLKTQARVEKTLYHYMYRKENNDCLDGEMRYGKATAGQRRKWHDAQTRRNRSKALQAQNPSTSPASSPSTSSTQRSEPTS